MNLSFSPEEETFRQEVRGFIARACTPEMRRAQEGEGRSKESYLAWHKTLY